VAFVPLPRRRAAARAWRYSHRSASTLCYQATTIRLTASRSLTNALHAYGRTHHTPAPPPCIYTARRDGISVSTTDGRRQHFTPVRVRACRVARTRARERHRRCRHTLYLPAAIGLRAPGAFHRLPPCAAPGDARLSRITISQPGVYGTHSAANLLSCRPTAGRARAHQPRHCCLPYALLCCAFLRSSRTRVADRPWRNGVQAFNSKTLLYLYRTQHLQLRVRAYRTALFSSAPT